MNKLVTFPGKQDHSLPFFFNTPAVIHGSWIPALYQENSLFQKLKQIMQN